MDGYPDGTRGGTFAADPDDIDAAYRECERITGEQARNFAWGIRLLPAPKRRALSAVYALARRIDDIGDGDLPGEEKLRLLAAARAGALAPAEHPDDPVLLAVADAATRLPIPLGAFGELVDGCEMDVTGRSYDDLDELVVYCRCVAGSIGRLCLGVFNPVRIGPPSEEAAPAAPGLTVGAVRASDAAAQLADALGVALQLTNILRDIREDHEQGRTYLPKRDLDLFGVEIRTLPDGTLDPCDGALAELIRFEAARAWGWYDRGLGLLDVLDRRSAACCGAMAGIYRQLLAQIAADPRIVMRGRASLRGQEKLRVAIRSLARRGGRNG